jgi:hypothetical protein
MITTMARVRYCTTCLARAERGLPQAAKGVVVGRLEVRGWIV